MMQFNNDYSLKSVAIYCRLSREDEDSRESSSIQSQKDMLTEYAKNNSWRIYDYYIDDGFTGTNFNRPAFKKMIKDIEQKKVNIVITKDLSRLGRNYLDTGRYTEEFFPMHNVRYIAINDNYDSAFGDNELAPFKNIINEWYAKDISKKVKSVIQTKYNKGEIYSVSKPLYGYKTNPETFERIIDPETAPVVRKIFEMYLDCVPMSKIIKYLSDNKIPFPGYYYYIKYNMNPNKYSSYTEKQGCTWDSNMVRRVIANRYEYLGNLILGKTRKISFKLEKRVLNHNENDIKFFEKKFEPIIDQETYDRVESIVMHRTYSNLPQEDNPYRELLVCGCCGHKLKIKKFKSKWKEKETITYRYICRNDHCENKVLVKREDIGDVINKYIKKLYKSLVGKDEKFIEFVKTYMEKLKNESTQVSLSNLDEEILNYQTRLEKLEKLIEKLFESNLNRQVPVPVYEKMMKKYKDESELLTFKIADLEKLKPKPEDDIDYLELAYEFLADLRMVDLKNITRDDMLSLIKSVKVTRRKNGGYNIHFMTYRLPTMVEEFLK